MTADNHIFVASRTRIILLLLFQQFFLGATKCTIDVSKDLNSSSPLLLDAESHQIIYPNKNTPRTLSIPSNLELIIQCPSGDLQPNFDSTSSDFSRCISGKIFSSLSRRKKYSFDRIYCSKNVEATTREEPNRQCEDGGVIIDLGYRLSANEFLKTIDLCYVDELATTRWSHSRLPGAVGGFRSREPQQSGFSKGGYFKNVLMSKVYPRNSQLQTFREIFDGDDDIVDKYLPSNGNRKNFLVKGHLVARADNFYHAEQQSTYFYMNALPMWQSINNGNWRSVESTVRRIAGIQGDLDVWTGGLGVLKLSGKEIFLAKDRKNEKKRLIPVPKLLFKLVYHSESNKALVFITVNNPYLEETKTIPAEYKVCVEYRECKDRFKQFAQRYEGYTYCCEYEDFARELLVNLPVYIENSKPLNFY